MHGQAAQPTAGLAREGRQIHKICARPLPARATARKGAAQSRTALAQGMWAERHLVVTQVVCVFHRRALGSRTVLRWAQRSLSKTTRLPTPQKGDRHTVPTTRSPPMMHGTPKHHGYVGGATNGVVPPPRKPWSLAAPRAEVPVRLECLVRTQRRQGLPWNTTGDRRRSRRRRYLRPATRGSPIPWNFAVSCQGFGSENYCCTRQKAIRTISILYGGRTYLKM